FKQLLDNVKKYIEKNYLPEPFRKFNQASMRRVDDMAASMAMPESSFDRVASKLPSFEPKSFSRALFDLIDARDLTDVEVYKKAGIDRRLFAKIRSDNYTPGKETVFRLILALELSLPEAKELLEFAGFSFSRASRLDLVVKYCVETKHYDLAVVNELLFSNDLPILEY
ncbi:MAG: hypothetical protein Q8N15_00240, partial [Bacillota bacterium]|nr:hypothetical protein [Bacillota bacterium]